MTREEAREIIRVIWKKPKSDNGNTDFYIDMFVEFGALKLDQSESTLVNRTWAALHGLRADYVSPSQIGDALDQAGLKVVRK